MAVQRSTASQPKTAMGVQTVIWTDTPILMRTGPLLKEPMLYHPMEPNGSMAMVMDTETMRLEPTRTSAQPRQAHRHVLGFLTQRTHNRTQNFLRMDAKTKMVTGGPMLLNPTAWMNSLMSILTSIEMV